MSKSPQNLGDNFFKYNGDKYFLSINLSTLDEEKYKHDRALKNDCIISFSYVNELNSFFLEGEIIYQDQYGVIDKFLDKPLTWCVVDFAKIEQKTDKNITVDKKSDVEAFMHIFFVNSIKILSREKNIITYKLTLISDNWLKCIQNISYSNYNTKPQKIFDIIKNMLAVNDLIVDSDSFDSIQSDVKINYITNGNDNTISAIKYLLSKLYYYENKDNSLKAIVYDEINNKFKAMDFASNISLSPVQSIIISLFNTDIEGLTAEEPIELNGVTKCKKTTTYENEFNLTFFDYNYNSNMFLDKSIPSKSIIDYKNNFFDSDEYRQKFLPFEKTTYKKNGSYWNNDFDPYHTAMKTIMEDNTIVVNVPGSIIRLPGSYIQLGIDRTVNDVETQSTERLKELKDKYKSLEGVYTLIKTRHIITPGQVQNDKQRYRQNLVISRNYLTK